MVLALPLFLCGCCLLALAVRQVHTLWGQASPYPHALPHSGASGGTPGVWTPFVVHAGMARADITRQYRALARLYHPDRGGDPRLMAHINERFAELMRRYPA